MDVKREIEELKKRIKELEIKLVDGEEKEEITIELENLNKRLKIFNMLIKDMAITRIIDNDEYVEKIYETYLKKIESKIDDIYLEQEKIENLINLEQKIVSQKLIYPVDIRNQMYRNLNENSARRVLNQFTGNNYNLVKEKIELIGLTPVKETALKLLARTNEISAINVSLNNDDKTKLAIHLIQICAYALNLESEKLDEFIKQNKDILLNEFDVSNKIFVGLNEKYEISYVDKEKVNNFIDLILSNKDKFSEFINNLSDTKDIFYNNEIIEDFLIKIKKLSSEDNYADLITLFRYYLIFDNYNVLVGYLKDTIISDNILESITINDNYTNSNINTKLYETNEKRKRSYKELLEREQKISFEEKRNKIINMLNGTLLNDIKKGGYYEYSTLKNNLVELQQEIELFNELKNKYDSYNNELSLLRILNETKRMRDLLETKSKLEIRIGELKDKIKVSDSELKDKKELSIVAGREVDAKKINDSIRKLEKEIKELKKDIEMIKKEISTRKDSIKEIEEKNIYVDSKGNEKNNYFSKLAFKMSKTFKNNKENKYKSLEEVNKEIKQLSEELDKKEREILSKESIIEEKKLLLTDNVVTYSEIKELNENLKERLETKKLDLEDCLEDIEKEKENSRAKRLELLEREIVRITIEFPERNKNIQRIINLIDKEKIKELDPMLYNSLMIPFGLIDNVKISDELIEQLGDIGNTISGVEDKYIEDVEIYNSLLAGTIDVNSLTEEEAMDILIKEDNFDRKLK